MLLYTKKPKMYRKICEKFIDFAFCTVLELKGQKKDTGRSLNKQGAGRQEARSWQISRDHLKIIHRAAPARLRLKSGLLDA